VCEIETQSAILRSCLRICLIGLGWESNPSPKTRNPMGSGRLSAQKMTGESGSATTEAFMKWSKRAGRSRSCEFAIAER
jgi:hypothetical protein